MTTISEPEAITATTLVLGETIVPDVHGNRFTLIRRRDGVVVAVDVPDEEEAPAPDFNAAHLKAANGGVYEVSSGPWTAALWLAWDHGWRSAGTKPGPLGPNATVSDTYLAFDGEEMSAKDARKCATGLLAGIDHYDRDQPRQSRGNSDTENPMLDLTCPALFPLDDARMASSAGGGFYSLSVNLWAEIRSHMRDEHGAVDGAAWRELAAFLRDSGGVTIHGGTPKVTP